MRYATYLKLSKDITYNCCKYCFLIIFQYDNGHLHNQIN